MANITKDQARELANKFRDLSQKIGDYRLSHQNLPPQQDRALEDAEWDLLALAGRMRDEVIARVFEDIDGGLAGIVKQTNRARRVINQLENAKDAIKISSALIKLSAAIITTNPTAVVGALGDLAGAIDSIVN